MAMLPYSTTENHKKIKISLKTINIFICILFFVFNFIKSKRRSINQYDFYLVYKQSDVFVICTENGTGCSLQELIKPSLMLPSNRPFVYYLTD